MKNTGWIVLFLVILLTAGSILSCVSSGQSTVPAGSSTLSQPLQDVSPLMPEMFQNVMGGGYGSADAVVQINAPFPDIPGSMVVYQVKKVDDARAQDIARLFGLEDHPVPLRGGERQVYSYADDEQVLEINFDGQFRLYQQKSNTSIPTSLPSNEECINIAREYLQARGLYPDNVARVEVGVSQTIIEAKAGAAPGAEIPVRLSVSFFIDINGGETPVLRVVIADGGRVVEVSCTQPQLIAYGTVQLKTPQAALQFLTDYLKDPTFPPVANHEVIANWRGEKLTVINRIAMEYAIPANTFYYQPVYVFEGDVYLAGQDNPEHFTGRVDAIQR
jgi:hypothetical protein